MDVIRLRAHHLGVIYNIVAGGEDAMVTLHCNLVSEGYPSSSIATVMALLEQVFSGTCDVEIVEGPDVVCTSGCLKMVEMEESENSFYLSSLVYHCLNKRAGTDTIMMRIFDVVSGKRYSSNVVIAKARALWQKHQFTVWQDLIDKFFIKEHRQDFNRLCEESSSAVKRP